MVQPTENGVYACMYMNDSATKYMYDFCKIVTFSFRLLTAPIRV